MFFLAENLLFKKTFRAQNLKKLRKKMKITDIVGSLADAWEKLRLGWWRGDPAPAFSSAATAQMSELLVPRS